MTSPSTNNEQEANLTSTNNPINLSSNNMEVEENSESSDEKYWWSNLEEFVSENEDLLNETLTPDQVETVKQFTKLNRTIKLDESDENSTGTPDLIRKIVESTYVECNEERRQRRKEMRQAQRRLKVTKGRVQRRQRKSNLYILKVMFEESAKAANKIASALLKVSEAIGLIAFAISEYTKIAAKTTLVNIQTYKLKDELRILEKEKVNLEMKLLHKQLGTGN